MTSEKQSLEPADTEVAATLQPLTAALLASVTPAEVVEVVVERGITALGALAGLVALVTRDGQELELVRTRGYAANVMEKWTRFPLSAPLPLSDVVREGVPQYFEDSAVWEAKYPAMVPERDAAFRASVSLPLAARQGVFGGIHFSFPESRRFSEHDRAFLEELSRQAALALERTLLLEEISAARRYQELLARASLLISETVDYQERLTRLARLCVEELADWAVVDEMDDAGRLQRLVVAHHDPAMEATIREIQRRYPPESHRHHTALAVIRTGEPFFQAAVSDEMLAQGAVDAEHIRQIRTLEIRSLLCLPITARERRLGAITLGRGGGRADRALVPDAAFTPEDIRLAEELTRHAAIAVDNARLYAEALRAKEEAQQQAQERAEAERRFRDMADHAPVLIWTSGTEGEYDWFNEPWLQFVGRAMEQEKGNGWTENLHPDDVERYRATYREAFAAHRPFTLEYRLRRSDGAWRWMLDNGIPRYAEADGREFVGYIGSCIDITEKKAAEKEAQRLLEEKTALARRQADLLTQQRAFLRDVLYAVTDGTLILCDSSAELPPLLSPLAGDVALTAAPALRLLRVRAQETALACGLTNERIDDLMTAVSEAGMNVVTHAGGRGTGTAVCDSAQGRVQVWIRDHGPGIPIARLHRAVLERGWTTAGTLGHGFFLMLKSADRIYLLTEEGTGTTVVIEKYRTPLTPDWFTLAGSAREAPLPP